jgi:hypothetical protein
MKPSHFLTPVLLVLWGAATVHACAVLEDFENGSNDGEWTWSAATVIEDAGGNPGAFIHHLLTNDFAPLLQTTAKQRQSGFLGDFREMDVTSLGVDLVAFVAGGYFDPEGNPFSIQRNLSIALFSGRNGVVVETNQLTPRIEDGWISYTVPIPSSSTTMPDGWFTYAEGIGPIPGKKGGKPEDRDAVWNEVIQNVKVIWISWGDPTKFWEDGAWDVGADNLCLSVGE